MENYFALHLFILFCARNFSRLFPFEEVFFSLVGFFFLLLSLRFVCIEMRAITCVFQFNGFCIIYSVIFFFVFLETILAFFAEVKALWRKIFGRFSFYGSVFPLEAIVWTFFFIFVSSHFWAIHLQFSTMLFPVIYGYHHNIE